MFWHRQKHTGRSFHPTVQVENGWFTVQLLYEQAVMRRGAPAEGPAPADRAVFEKSAVEKFAGIFFLK